MRKGLAVSLGVLVVLAVVIGVISNDDPAVTVNAAEVRMGDLERVVEASGEALAEEMYTVMPGVSGRVAKIYVSEGQDIKAGEKLFSFEDADAKALLKQSQLEMEAAVSAQKAQVIELALRQEEIDAREAAEVMAQAQSYQAAPEQTYATLMNEVIAQAQGDGVDIGVLNKAIEAAALLRESAASDTEAALVSGSIDTPLEEAIKEREEQGAKAVENLPESPEVSLCKEKVRRAEELLSSLTMTSEIGGTVLGMSLKQGEIAAAGSSAIVIGDTKRMRVVLKVPEYDLRNVQVGQTAWLLSNGTQGFGKVVKKSTALSSGSYGEVYGEVEIQPDDGFAPLVGASVEAEIILAKSEDILYVPRECVVSEDSGKFVYTCNDSKVKKMQVTTGLENDFYVEIVSGAVIGDVLVIAPFDLEDGGKVIIEA